MPEPAFALIAFPAAWAALGWWGYRRAGIRGAVAVAATGPAGLAATIKVAEQGQLLFLVSRAYRRANGTVLEQFEHARQDLVETVGAALATAQPSVTR